MPINESREKPVQLEELSEKLTNSLERCQELVEDYRAKLAANSNDLQSPEAGAETA